MPVQATTKWNPDDVLFTGIVTLGCFCRRFKVLKEGTSQSNAANLSKLCAIACSSVKLNRHLITKQSYIGA